MLPTLEALLAGYALYARQNRFAPERDEARLADALREAAVLASGNPDDEPAALFFALGRRRRVFGNAHGRMTLHLAVEQARSRGLALTTDVSVLELIRARVLRDEIDFEELCEWFATHLAPITRRPWPPR
jgi:hypothetical protein